MCPYCGACPHCGHRRRPYYHWYPEPYWGPPPRPVVTQPFPLTFTSPGTNVGSALRQARVAVGSA